MLPTLGCRRVRFSSNAEGCGHVVEGRGRRIVHMSIARRARGARLPSSVGFRSAHLAQLAEDQILGLLRPPGFDAPLQGSQLCLAGVGVWHHLRQPVHEFLGGGRRFGDEPPFDHWPGMLERVQGQDPGVSTSVWY